MAFGYIGRSTHRVISIYQSVNNANGSIRSGCRYAPLLEENLEVDMEGQLNEIIDAQHVDGSNGKKYR